MPYRRIGFSDRLSTSVTDDAGNLADPGALILKLKDPANAVTTHTWPGDLIRDGQGLFHFVLAGLTALGLYRYKWNTTGTSTGVSPNPKTFTLVDEWTPILLTMEGAKSVLNSSVPDPDIELYVDSVTEWLERQLGPIVARPPATRRATVSLSGDLYMPTMVVPGSITAATNNGTAVSVTGWTYDELNLRLVRPTPELAATFRPWSTIDVTYTPGCDPMPAPLTDAAGLLVQSAYDNQRGPAGLPLAAAQDEAFGSSYPLALQARDKWKLYAAPSVA